MPTQKLTAAVTVQIMVPVGTIVPFPGNDIPKGWLLCDGRKITSNSYPSLFSIVGDTVPDLRGRFPVSTGSGAGLSSYALNDKGGLEKVTLAEGEIPPHRHYGFGESWGTEFWPFGVQGNKDKPGSKGGKDNDNYYYGTTDTGGGQSHENRPPYQAINFIIKY